MARQKVKTNPIIEFTIANHKSPGVPCSVCLLPKELRDVIDEARRQSPPGARAGTKLIGSASIRAYLINVRGLDAEEAPSSGALDRHFKRGHHEVDS